MRRSLLVVPLALLVAAFARAAPAIDVQPREALEGEPVALRVVGLAPGQVVTLHATRRFERFPTGDEAYAGHARFAAGPDGTVDLATALPLAGSAYAQADASGLFWSMAPMTRDPQAAERVRTLGLAVPPSPDTGDVALALEVDGRIVARSSVRLAPAAPEVVVREVRAPGLVGVYAHAPGRARQPALLVLGGSEGGLFTARSLAPRLASHGFAVLGIATFQGSEPGALPLPPNLELLPLESLDVARRWLAGQPGVAADRVALVGVSKGAEMALVAAAHFPWIAAVAAFAPSHVVWEGVPHRSAPAGAAAGSSWTVGGRPVPYVRWLPEAERRYVEVRRASGEARLTEVHLEALAEHAADVPAASIAVERARAAYFLAAGIDDGRWPAAYAAQRIAARLAAAGYAQPVQVEQVPTGHLILGSGWAPTTTFQRGAGRSQGGNPALDAAAQQRLWPRLITFLKATLP